MHQADSSPTTTRSFLRDANIRSLWLGQLISLLGDRLHQIALLVLVGTLTGNNLGQIGLLFVTIGLPTLLFGLVAGPLVDSWDRRRVMIVSDLLRAPLVLAIPLVAPHDLRLVYLLTFLLTTVSLFFRPAKQAILPALVPEERLLAANSLFSVTDTAADVLGYPLAGLLLVGLLATGRGATTLAFAVDAASYLFSALMISRLSVSSRPTGGSIIVHGVVEMARDGVRFLLASRILRTNTILWTLAVLISFGSWTLSFGYATTVTGTGGLGYAMLEAALGLGAVLGGLAVGRWGERYPAGPTILVGLIVMGIGTAPLALFANVWLAATLLMLTGVGNMLALIPSITLAQTLTPDALRGRVIGLRHALFALALVLANAIAGIGASWWGVQGMLGMTGVLLAVLGLGGFVVPSARMVTDAGAVADREGAGA